METTAAEVKQQLDSHEQHCNERHQAINITLTRLTSDVENIKNTVGNMQQDIHGLRGEMSDLRGEMSTLRRDVDNKIDGLRADMENRFEAMRREMRWMMGMGVGFLSLLITVSSFIG